MTKASPKAPSLRDARKHRTREALKNAALKLFASQGYEATSTEEIAEKAGVSWRTFFRYYPTKESVLLGGKNFWFSELSDAYCNQSESLSDIDALYAALMDLAPNLSERRARLRLYERSFSSSPTLRGMRQDSHDDSVRQLATVIAARRGLEAADAASMLLAAVGVLMLRQALGCWLSSKDDTELEQYITNAFVTLTEAFMRSDALTLTAPKSEKPPRPATAVRV